MELYLFRHGIAEDTPRGKSDADRKLTEEGRKKTAAVARLARSAGVGLSLIISSPLIRAIETAQIAAHELGYKSEILQSKALAPDSTPEAVWDEVREHRAESAILLAGHEPLLSRTFAHLLQSPGLQVEMKKSALARIDFESLQGAPRGILRWMITPKLTG